MYALYYPKINFNFIVLLQVSETENSTQCEIKDWTEDTKKYIWSEKLDFFYQPI